MPKPCQPLPRGEQTKNKKSWPIILVRGAAPTSHSRALSPRPVALNDLRDKRIRAGTEVLFSTWSVNVESRARLLRKGTIDHIAYRGGYIAFTVFLDGFVSALIPLPRVDHYLCRYIDATPTAPDGPLWMAQSQG